MRRYLLRWAPIALVALLLLSLMIAVVEGGRGNWLAVAVIALAIAANLWFRDHTISGRKPPSN